MIAVADATRLPFADQSVDLVFGSPPYCDARTYGIGAQRDCQTWIDWMLAVTTECLRVSRGPVVWVAAGVTRDRNYWPACEGLMYEWWKRGGSMYRPCYWHRVGIPGSGGDQWFRADVEYVMCFKRPGKLAWSDNVAMGHPPKWGPGGEMSYRLSDGARVNAWGHGGDGPTCVAKKVDGTYDRRNRPSNRVIDRKHTKREPDGAMRVQGYVVPKKANPGNLVKTLVGGGHCGDRSAHENEAPFPEKLAEWFILSLCPPGGTVLDCFSGSGTTASVAKQTGRKFVATDIRLSQAQLTRRRVASAQVRLIA